MYDKMSTFVETRCQMMWHTSGTHPAQNRHEVSQLSLLWVATLRRLCDGSATLLRHMIRGE